MNIYSYCYYIYEGIKLYMYPTYYIFEKITTKDNLSKIFKLTKIRNDKLLEHKEDLELKHIKTE